MKLMILCFCIGTIHLAAHAQVKSLDQVELNLTNSKWAVRAKNETGTFYNGTGLYKFFKFINEGDAKAEYIFSAKISDKKTHGSWRVYGAFTGKDTTYYVDLVFENSINSPVQPNAPISFEIRHPFTAEKMELWLLPPPDQKNVMFFDKSKV